MAPNATADDLPLGRGVTVIGRDPTGVIALDKPPGVLSHPNTAADGPRSLLVAAYHAKTECYEWRDGAGAIHRAWLLHRLDSATSGAILVCADEALARRIRARFEEHEVAKTYVALVFGRARDGEEEWRDRLAIDKSGGQVRTRANTARGQPHRRRRPGPRSSGGPRGTGAVEAIAVARRLRLVAAGPFPRSLIELLPRTGRSHQLRVQCAARGLPIAGDQTYGDFRTNRAFARATGHKRLFLHAARISFTLDDGRPFAAASPIPTAFGDALRDGA